MPGHFFFFETEPAKELPIVLIRREGPNILDSGYVVCIQIQLLALNKFSLESIKIYIYFVMRNNPCPIGSN